MGRMGEGASIELTGDAVVAEVIDGKFFYKDDPLVRLEGTMDTVAIVPGSSAYPQGYHVGDGGGLPAIDGDLINTNIRSGVTIFNVAGHTDVRNVSDANAVLADVKSGKTFYAVGGARKTGNLATVAIVAANDNYPAGYHAGNGGGLDAIDIDLASVNIKFGTTIFGKAGHTDVRNVSDADVIASEVKDGKTFYAVGGARKTGTADIPPAGALIFASANAYISGSGSSYVKQKDLDIALSGAELEWSTLSTGFLMNIGSGATAYGRIYKNGGAVGTERSTSSSSWVTFKEEIAFADGDNVQLYARETGSYSFRFQDFYVGPVTSYTVVCDDCNP